MYAGSHQTFAYAMKFGYDYLNAFPWSITSGNCGSIDSRDSFDSYIGDTFWLKWESSSCKPFPKQAIVCTCLPYETVENTVGKWEMSNFSFSHGVFNPLRELSAISLSLKLPSFSLDQSEILSFRKGFIGRKHTGKWRKCLFLACFPFPTILILMVFKTWSCLVKG